jgi:hypothetical protein
VETVIECSGIAWGHLPEQGILFSSFSPGHSFFGIGPDDLRLDVVRHGDFVEMKVRRTKNQLGNGVVCSIVKHKSDVTCEPFLLLRESAHGH